jgi:SlyX protein
MEERVIELESAVAHLQHELDQINEVVLRQQAEVHALTNTLRRLEGRLALLSQEPEERLPSEERPPHY